MRRRSVFTQELLVKIPSKIGDKMQTIALPESLFMCWQYLEFMAEIERLSEGKGNIFDYFKYFADRYSMTVDPRKLPITASCSAYCTEDEKLRKNLRLI